MSEHVLTIFKELFDELKSMKRQQWTITNYAALLLAAVYVLKEHLSQHWIFSHIVWAIAAIALFLLLRIQWNVGRSRQRIDSLHKSYFTEQELEEIGLTEKERDALGSKTQFQQSIRGWEFLSVLIGVVITGALLVYFVPPK